MPVQDPYAVLGVGASATLAEVKGAYRRLAHQFHPDKNPGDPAAEARFREVVDAYTALRDPQTRAAPSRPRAAARRSPDPHLRPARGPAARPWTRGADVMADVRIALSDVLHGTDRVIHIDRDVCCVACQGSGTADVADVRVCTTCHGRGYAMPGGRMPVRRRVCAACHGTGQRPARSCSHCDGRALVRSAARLRLRIPPGMRSGGAIRFAGEGHAGACNGPRGDLLLTVEVEPHSHLTREGLTLCATVSVTPAQAALGTTVAVELLDGPVRIRVRPGMQPGAAVRFPHRGLPTVGNPETRGDAVIRFTVAVPTRLTAAQSDLYGQLASLETAAPPAPAGRVRRLWHRLRRPRP